MSTFRDSECVQARRHSRQVSAPLHPAAGRATARPPAQALPSYDAEDLPSAGSPPGGGSGPVFTGGA